MPKGTKMGRAKKKNPIEPGIRAWQVQRSSGYLESPIAKALGYCVK